MKLGFVNITIPLYNQEQYVEASVMSALNQTYPNFDVTVVNDGSTDHSRIILQEMLDRWNRDVRPTVCTHEDGMWDFWGRLKFIDRENRGLSVSRNEGIWAGDGEFILPLDSDDWIDPDYLAKTVPLMQDPKVGIVSTDMQYEGLLHNRIPPKGLSLESQMQSNNLPVCSLIRRAAFEQTKGYETLFVDVAGSTKVLGYEDWEMWISIMKRGWTVAILNEPLFHYTVRAGSMISQSKTQHNGLVRLIHLLHPDLFK